MKLLTKFKRIRLGMNMLKVISMACMLTACSPSPDESVVVAPTLSVTPSTLEFASTANNTRSVTIVTDANWSVNVQNVSWLSIDYVNGNGNATVNFTTTSDAEEVRENDVVFQASNEGGVTTATVHVKQKSPYPAECAVDVSKEPNAVLKMSYGFACRLLPGDNTKFIKYYVYESKEYVDNLQGDKKKIEEEAANKWTRLNISVDTENAIIYDQCEPNKTYFLVMIPYTSSGTRGPLCEYVIDTKPAEQAHAQIEEVQVRGDNYEWNMVKRNNSYDYHIYACANRSEFRYFTASKDKRPFYRRGIALAWALLKELQNDQMEHSTNLNSDTNGREKIFNIVSNNETRSFQKDSRDKYLEIVTWAKDNNGNRSGVLYDVLYTIENGTLIPVAEEDRLALKDVSTASYTSASPTIFSTEATAITCTINVSSNENWTATSDATSWCIVSPASGSSLGTITVSVSANSSTASRTAHITVTGEESGNKTTVTLTQAGSTPVSTLTVDKSSLSFGYLGGSGSFNISSNTSWTVTSNNSSWCTISPASGSNNGSVTVTVSENTASSDRSAIISVSGGNISRTVTVTQGHQEANVPGEDDNPLPQYSKRK